MCDVPWKFFQEFEIKHLFLVLDYLYFNFNFNLYFLFCMLAKLGQKLECMTIYLACLVVAQLVIQVNMNLQKLEYMIIYLACLVVAQLVGNLG